jgi:hypothetical protein
MPTEIAFFAGSVAMQCAPLVALAACIVRGTIKLKPMIVPNFHFSVHEEFIERWTAADGQRVV